MNKRKQLGFVDVEDNYSEEQVLNIIKEDVNIHSLMDLKTLPSNSVRDFAIFRMNKELMLTPKTIEKMTQLSATYIRIIVKKYEESLNIDGCVPNETNSCVGDCPQ